MYKTIAPVLLTVLLTACGSEIWNGADLQKWVHEQAVKSGCDSESIVLGEWYTERDGENIWLGTCSNGTTGELMDLEISVDEVWTPSDDD